LAFGAEAGILQFFCTRWTGIALALLSQEPPMASLQKKNDTYYCQLLYHRKRHTFTVGRVSEAEAQAKARQVEYLLMRLKQRLVRLPDGIDIVTFVQHDGRPPDGTALPESPRKAATLAHLKDRYLATLGNGTVEANSLYTLRIHLNHAGRILGYGLPLGELSLGKLQAYVDARAGEGVSAYTVRKEVRTLKAAWAWGTPMKLTAGAFPSDGLRYPKQDEKPPFQTRREIERQLAAGGDPDVLWECLYLRPAEVAELLEWVRGKTLHPWIYPAVCFAAHTGARRSEIIRALAADVDFAGDTVLIREKKRIQGQRTTRCVPLTPFLRGVLEDWLHNHPGGSHLFCQGGTVARSKTRSATTGHRSEKVRPSSRKARLASVRKRPAVAATPITRDQFHDHFTRTLQGSAWDVVRGPHVLRHSFCSALAARGVDQRIIDEIVGHHSPETVRRYRHLIPDVKQEAVRSVFG
jgi:integrase